MSVLKFGGSSLADVQKVQNVASYIKKRAQNEQIIVVVSAMGKTTNALFDLAESIVYQGEAQTKAEIITQGENLSAALLCYALEGLKQKAVWLDSRAAGIHCMGDSLNAIITSIDKQPILSYLKKGEVVIVTGFQGNSSGRISALGRGGSDTTAVALSIVFDMPVEIHTDVDGFYNLDPNKHKGASKKDKIDISSALESATVGAKVLDKRCLALAQKHKKEILTLASTKEGGTKVVFNPLEGFNIDCITCKNGFLLVKNLSFLYKNLQTTFHNNQILFFQANNKRAYIFLENKVEKAREADLVLVSGSGLNTNDIIEKVLSISLSFSLISFHPTMIKIVVPSGKGDEIVEKLKEQLL